MQRSPEPDNWGSPETAKLEKQKWQMFNVD
jgi:hypothetical protein